MAKAVGKNKQIKALNLSRKNLDHTALQSILSGLPANGKLESLDVSDNNLVFCCDITTEQILGRFRLKNLNLGRNNISPEGLDSLFAGLLKKTSIKSLDLSSNNLKDDDAKTIANFLNKYFGLASLNLGGNDLSSQGILAILNALSHNKTAIDLDLAGNTLDAKGLKNISDRGCLKNANF
jgi:Ran GTPase-activating protein (RanGAP) involved in mRNA processing and transport